MSGWIDNSKANEYWGGRRNVSKAELEQTVLEEFYLEMLTEVYCNRFKWEGLPPEIDERFLERTLFYNGLSVFFWDDPTQKFYALQGAGSNALNPYNNPTQFHAWGNGMVNRQLGYGQTNAFKDCVPIWNNYARRPGIGLVSIYARRLARIDRTIDINVITARNPKVFKGDQSIKLSALNVANQLNAGVDFLMITGDMAESLDSLDMGIDVDGFEKLHTLRARVYNECMGFMGIDNANQEKKERLIEGEVEANEEQTDISRAIAMNAREAAALEINSLYADRKLNVRVEYRGSSKAVGMQSDLGIEGVE